MWLSNLDFEGPHDKARMLRFNNTNRWLFAKPEFLGWIGGETSSMLWLNGKGTISWVFIRFKEKV